MNPNNNILSIQENPGDNDFINENNKSVEEEKNRED